MSTSPRALIYLRVSTDKQANKGVSLPTQEERCLGRAIDAGYVVEPKHDIYLEPGETGTNMKRPALMDLLARCKEDKSVRAVIIYDLSRLARDRIDFALIKHTLRKARISLLSVTEPIDDTPEGQMLEGVLSTVAEFYSAQSGRKVRDSMRHKAEIGCWPNKAPYGYVNRKEELPEGRYARGSNRIRRKRGGYRKRSSALQPAATRSKRLRRFSTEKDSKRVA